MGIIKFKNICEKEIIYISLFVFFAGMAIVFLSSMMYKPQETQVSSINYTHIGNFVFTCGYIDSLRENEDGTFFMILADRADRRSTIQIVFFKDYAKSNNIISTLEKEAFACVSGDVDLYKGNLEIVGRKIEQPKQ